MKEKLVQAHMHAAIGYAALSHCCRRKVGCVIVKDDSIIAFGYNGTPSEEDNTCEDADGNTKPTVIHAEDNALRKLTRRTESAVGGIMFVTTAPCELCAPRIADAGITKVYYVEVYRNDKGLQYLKKRNIETEQV